MSPSLGAAGPFRDTLDHPWMRQIIDAYLQAWIDYASVPELRGLLGHALRLAPLRRSRALITNFASATGADTDDLGPTPRAWLTATVVEEGA